MSAEHPPHPARARARSPLMLLALVLVWSTGCGPEPEDPKPPVTPTPVGPVHAPFDVEAVVRQAQLDPRVSAELELTTPVALPLNQEQSHSAVAFDGTNYLVVWYDKRNVSPQIHGARVRPDGTLLDKNGFRIAAAPFGTRYAPAVAFDGTQYLVVWSDSRNNSSYDIYGARVKPDGTVMDPSGILIGSNASLKENPALAYDGTQYLVVWEQWGAYSFIYGTRVKPDGTVLDPGGKQLSLRPLDINAPGSRLRPAVTFDGTQFLVVWHMDGWLGGIFGTRVAADGTVLDPGEITFPALSGAKAPTVASDGTQSLVVWGDGNIRGARIRPDGTLVDPAAFTISSAVNVQETPVITFDGTSFWVAWSDYRVSTSPDIYAAQVKPDGTVVQPQGVLLCSATRTQSQPAVASGAGQWFATWTDSRRSELDIHGARITPTGTVLDPNGQVLSTRTASQNNLAVAYDGTQYLVVWDELRLGNGQDLFGVRVRSDGTVIDAQPIAISTAIDNQDFPAVVFDGTQFVVFWNDRRSGSTTSVYRARVTRDGRVLDPSGVVTSGSSAMMPAVTFDGTQTFVVWQQTVNGSSDIYGLRLNQAGQSLDGQGRVISQAPGHQLHPAVTFTGSHFLVVWMDWRTDGLDKIYGARVKPDFTRLDADGFRISPAQGEEPSLATDGQNTLVVWGVFRNSMTRYDVQAARVSPDGQVLDPTGILLTQGPGDEERPTVSFDGTQYQVVWHQTSDIVAPTQSDLYGARITPEGTLLEPGGVALSEDAESESSPAIATNGAGACLVVYDHWSPSLNSDRARARFLTPPGLDATCPRDEACASNHASWSPP